MKLELKKEEIIPYLPYRLNCLNQHLPDIELVVEELIGISNHITWSGAFNAMHGSNHVPICGIKPILRPLSDFKEVIVRNIRIELELSHNQVMEFFGFLDGQIKLDNITLGLYNAMCQKHIDFNKLIEKGLAIDINTL